MGNKNVAILGLETERRRQPDKKVVFLHREGGDKRLSFSTTRARYSSRLWESIVDGDPNWESFKKIVGETTYLCKA